MKFARYLEETQIPEWKKAYIDYRGLKKRITAIRRANEAARAQERNSDNPPRSHNNQRSSISQPSPGSFTPKSYGAVGRTPPNAIGRSSTSGAKRTPPAPVSFSPSRPMGRTPPAGNKSAMRMSHDELGPDFELPPAMESLESLKESMASQSSPNVERRRAVPSRYFSETLSAVSSRSDTLRRSQESARPPPIPAPTVAAPVTTIPQTEPRSRRLYSFSGMRRRMTVGSRTNDSAYSPPAPSNVDDLLAGLGPNELAFFTAFDQEIDKVDTFYSERERDAMLKVAALKEQFHELRGHKQLTNETQEGLWPGFLHLLDSINIPAVLPIPGQAGKSPDTSVKTGTPQTNTQLHAGPSLVHDPDAYQRAKKKLKKAVLEFYRGLELLQNYRILNMTGFRKALKKFDKTTKISSQALYMRERVETRSFASGETCDYLLKQIEQIYATRFEKGDAKKARARLRATHRETTHHFSTFRSGMLLGLSIPALAMGIYYSLQSDRREEIPEWAALLQVYAALGIPVIFSLLIGLNLIAWARARINFIFIFELDARTVIDAREYIELPAFLFTTLAYAFWLSFSRSGADTIAPTTWPLAWLGLAVGVLASPLPMFHRSARYWLLRTVGKLFISGRTRVEFTDFWMGDQFCSLVYTMGNLYFLVCAYADGWHHIEERCQLGPHWSIPLVLTALPSIIRLVQCVRRWFDSKNYIHLVNGGKYTASIVNYIAYYAWRHYGSQRDFRFGIWVLFATINSCYTSYWDLTMDWSVLQFKGIKYKFLRKDLAYASYVPVYYIAIVTNVIVRFIWVWYIPTGGLAAGSRSFILAVLEMIRRVQWNFFRLENEHIGNADQFRVTREVPLPYVFTGEVDSDDDDGARSPASRPLSVRLPEMRGKARAKDVEGEDEL